MKFKRILLASLGACLLLIAACSSTSTKEQPNVSPQQTQANNDVSSLNWRVPAFTAIDHNGKPFSSQDLKGKLWLVDVVFTRCNNVCPPMTANLAKVQKSLKAQNVDVKIVSFSVDPDYDQPKVLTQFANKYQADLTNWSFLTGYPLKTIQNISQTAFKGTITQRKGPTPEVPILVDHPTRSYLIDGTGKVVRFYNGLSPDANQIGKDIKQLQSK